jgi:hypothetical protein
MDLAEVTPGAQRPGPKFLTLSSAESGNCHQTVRRLLCPIGRISQRPVLRRILTWKIDDDERHRSLKNRAKKLARVSTNDCLPRSLLGGSSDQLSAFRRQRNDEAPQQPWRRNPILRHGREDQRRENRLHRPIHACHAKARLQAPYPTSLNAEPHFGECNPQLYKPSNQLFSSFLLCRLPQSRTSAISRGPLLQIGSERRWRAVHSTRPRQVHNKPALRAHKV